MQKLHRLDPNHPNFFSDIVTTFYEKGQSVLSLHFYCYFLVSHVENFTSKYGTHTHTHTHTHIHTHTHTAGAHTKTPGYEHNEEKREEKREHNHKICTNAAQNKRITDREFNNLQPLYTLVVKNEDGTVTNLKYNRLKRCDAYKEDLIRDPEAAKVTPAFKKNMEEKKQAYEALCFTIAQREKEKEKVEQSMYDDLKTLQEEYVQALHEFNEVDGKMTTVEVPLYPIVRDKKKGDKYFQVPFADVWNEESKQLFMRRGANVYLRLIYAGVLWAPDSKTATTAALEFPVDLMRNLAIHLKDASFTYCYGNGTRGEINPTATQPEPTLSTEEAQNARRKLARIEQLKNALEQEFKTLVDNLAALQQHKFNSLLDPQCNYVYSDFVQHHDKVNAKWRRILYLCQVRPQSTHNKTILHARVGKRMGLTSTSFFTQLANAVEVTYPQAGMIKFGEMNKADPCNARRMCNVPRCDRQTSAKSDRYQHFSSEDATYYFRQCDYHRAQNVSFLPCKCSNPDCNVHQKSSKAIRRGKMSFSKWKELFEEHSSKDVAFCCPDCKDKCRMCTWPWQTCTNTIASRSYCKDHYFQKLANSTISIECKGNLLAAIPPHTILKQSVTQNQWKRFLREEVLCDEVGSSIAESAFICHACASATVAPQPGSYVDKSSVVHDDNNFVSLLIRTDIATGKLNANDDDAWAYAATDGELASNNQQPERRPPLTQTTIANTALNIQQSKSRKHKRVITEEKSDQPNKNPQPLPAPAPTRTLTNTLDNTLDNTQDNTLDIEQSSSRHNKRVITPTTDVIVQKRAKTHATSTPARNTRSNMRTQAHAPIALSEEEEERCKQVLATARLKLEEQAASLIKTPPTNSNYKQDIELKVRELIAPLQTLQKGKGAPLKTPGEYYLTVRTCVDYHNKSEYIP